MSALVCVLAAGLGTRLGPRLAHAHKALLPVGEKAALTHIFERFPADSHFIVAVGYHADLIKEYVSLAHSKLNVNYVHVEPFAGPGSGPGTSVVACQAYLKTPFFVVCADTIWSEELPLQAPTSWIGVAPVSGDQAPHYCLVESNEVGGVSGFRDKQKAKGSAPVEASIGLFYVREPHLFFAGFAGKEMIRGELQLSSGLESLCTSADVRVHQVKTWRDIGTQEQYAKVSSSYMVKSGEFFYHVGEQVIKYYDDADIVSHRVKRSCLSNGRFPVITGSTAHFYSYRYVEGKTFYEEGRPELMPALMKWLEDEIWPLGDVATENLPELCHRFYKDKTYERVERFRALHADLTFVDSINGECVEPLEQLLDQVPWHVLTEGVSAFVHGDLQFSNILYTPANGRFTAIDWRQDFGGALDYGDLYYDLAKLLTGCIVDFSALEHSPAQFRKTRADIEVKLPSVPLGPSYIAALETYMNKRQLSMKRIQLLSALILVNIAPLHGELLGKAFFSEGYLRLHRLLSEDLRGVGVA